MDKKTNDAYATLDAFSTLCEICRMLLNELENAQKIGVYDLDVLKDAIESFNKESKCVFDACVCVLENDSGYHMVDLGLPSGLKWADRNVGAASPQDYGDYFMWGSTTPDTDKPCDWAHAPFNGGSSKFDEEYFKANSGTWLTEGYTLKPEYDAAHVNMGDGWRMPTSAEMRELIDGTTWSVETLNGVRGVRFTSTANGKSIFMPFAGYRDRSYADGVGYGGNAWLSSLIADYEDYSRNLDFDDDGNVSFRNYSRRYGFVVRGVHE